MASFFFLSHSKAPRSWYQIGTTIWEITFTSHLRFIFASLEVLADQFLNLRFCGVEKKVGSLMPIHGGRMSARKQETLEAVLGFFYPQLSHLPRRSSFLFLLDSSCSFAGLPFRILSGWLFGILEFCSFAVFFWKPFLSLVLRWFRTTRFVLVRESFLQDCYFLMEDKDTRMFFSSYLPPSNRHRKTRDKCVVSPPLQYPIKSHNQPWIAYLSCFFCTFCFAISGTGNHTLG